MSIALQNFKICMSGCKATTRTVHRELERDMISAKIIGGSYKKVAQITKRWFLESYATTDLLLYFLCSFFHLGKSCFQLIEFFSAQMWPSQPICHQKSTRSYFAHKNLMLKPNEKNSLCANKSREITHRVQRVTVRGAQNLTLLIW